MLSVIKKKHSAHAITADVDIIDKVTEARIDPGTTVNARSNIIVRAQSFEDVISVGATLGFSKNVAVALDQIDTYLTRKIRILFEPLLEYLKDCAGPRSASEIETHFKNQLNLSGATMACEWLSDKDVIQTLSSPVRLTEKSQISVEEAAFYYDEA